MSWLSQATQAAGQAAGDLVGAVSDVEHSVVGNAGDAWKAIKKLYDGVLEAVMDDTVGVRTLRSHERNLAKGVYKNSLPPLNNILIVSLSGIDGRAFTLPASLVAPLADVLFGNNPLILLLALSSLAAKGIEQYLIFLGKEGFRNAMGAVKFSTTPGDVFIHELGHVWQGYNSAFTWWYVFNSIYYQIACGSGAYEATPGGQWAQYGAEQQAMLIEDWYTGGEPTSGQLYSYMDCNVWPGKPFATTTL
jgi:hypothetical protein